MQPDPKASSVRSAMVDMLILRGIFALVSLGSLVIFGRLLDAKQFGLMAMATTILTLVGIFRDFGLAAAAIQKVDLSETDRDELFGLSLIVAVVAFLFIVVAAPFFSAAYGEPELTLVLWVSSIAYLLWGLQAQHAAGLRRKMRFRSVLTAEGCGITLGLAVGALVAWIRQDVWALVAMNLTQAAVNAVLMFAADPWLPVRWRRPENMRQYLIFGRDFMSHALLTYLSTNWGQIVLGLRFGATELGYFNRAQQIVAFPQTLLLTPLQEVSTPVLSRQQQNPEGFQTTYLHILHRAILVMFPVAALLPFVSDNVVLLLLGRGWSATATVLACFAPAIAAQAVLMAVQVGLLAMGRVAEMRNLGLADAVLKLAASLAGLSFGGPGVAIALSLTGLLVTMPLGIAMMARRGPSVRLQVPCVLEGVCVGAAAAVTSYLLDDWVARHFAINFFHLVAITSLGLASAGLVALALPRSRATIVDTLRVLGLGPRARPATSGEGAE